MFKRILLSACLAGLVAGLILTGLQRFQAVPLVLEAERYEAAGADEEVPAEGAGGAHAPRAGESGLAARLRQALTAFMDREAQWAPAEGWERTLYTGVANVSAAVGFALLLCAAFSLRRDVGWREGALWGLAGYAVFFVLPGLGLPPELPGTASAALAERQAWWLLTVVCSGAGLALALLRREWAWKLAGVALLGLPHLVGAPQPETHGGGTPHELAEAFVWATALVNGVFWIVLGGTSGFVFRKLA